MFERYPEIKRDTSQTFWYRRVYLNDLLNKEPNNIDAKIDLSQVLINQVLHLPFKDQADAFYVAEGYLEEAMKVQTDYVPIYKGLGYLYLNWKKYAKARDNY